MGGSNQSFTADGKRTHDKDGQLRIDGRLPEAPAQEAPGRHGARRARILNGEYKPKSDTEHPDPSAPHSEQRDILYFKDQILEALLIISKLPNYQRIFSSWEKEAPALNSEDAIAAFVKNYCNRVLEQFKQYSEHLGKSEISPPQPKNRPEIAGQVLDSIDRLSNLCFPRQAIHEILDGEKYSYLMTFVPENSPPTSD